MYNNKEFKLGLIICMLCLTNCSILIFKSETERLNKIAQDHAGWTQEEMEECLGPPIATVKHEDGSTTCVYEFKKGFVTQQSNVDSGENLLLGIDAITLGLGEIFLTPIVLYGKYKYEINSPKMRALVTYDLNNKVKVEKCNQVE